MEAYRPHPQVGSESSEPCTTYGYRYRRPPGLVLISVSSGFHPHTAAAGRVEGPTWGLFVVTLPPEQTAFDGGSDTTSPTGRLPASNRDSRVGPRPDPARTAEGAVVRVVELPVGPAGADRVFGRLAGFSFLGPLEFLFVEQAAAAGAPGLEGPNPFPVRDG